MIATFAFNGSILLALVIIPIIHPEVLPQITYADPIDALVPAAEQRPVVRTEPAQSAPSATWAEIFQAPPIIQRQISYIERPGEPSPDIGPIDLGGGSNVMGGPDDPFGGRGTHPDVRPAVEGTQHVSSRLMEGMLIYKVIPKYPPMAIATHTSGMVVLQATISRSGTIENLHVVGGPGLLQQAALDAVKQWRYRPYLLNGQPVEVETTVNVNFTME